MKLKQALIEGGIAFGNPEMDYPNIYPIDIGINDKFYLVGDAPDCFYVREHGAKYHLAKCTTKETAELIIEALINLAENLYKKWRDGMLPFEDQVGKNNPNGSTDLHYRLPDSAFKMNGPNLELKDGLYSVDLDVTVVEQTRRKDLVPCAIWQDGTTQIKLLNYEYRKVLRIN